VHVRWIAAKMPLRSIQVLPQRDHTAAASIDLGQRLPRKIAATAVVHVLDESFTGSEVRFLRATMSCPVSELSDTGSAPADSAIISGVVLGAKFQSGKTAGTFSTEHYSEGEECDPSKDVLSGINCQDHQVLTHNTLQDHRNA